MEYSQIIAANKTRCLSGEAKEIFSHVLLLSKLKHHRTDILLLLLFRSAQNPHIGKILSASPFQLYPYRRR